VRVEFNRTEFAGLHSVNVDGTKPAVGADMRFCNKTHRVYRTAFASGSVAGSKITRIIYA